MKVLVNGEKREIPPGADIEMLLGFLDLPTERVAVERNREVVRKGNWSGTRLEEDDRIEIIHFVGGG